MEKRYFRQIEGGLHHTAALDYLGESEVEIEFHFAMDDGQSRIFISNYDLSDPEDKEALDGFLAIWKEESQAENWGIAGLKPSPKPDEPERILDDLFAN